MPHGADIYRRCAHTRTRAHVHTCTRAHAHMRTCAHAQAPRTCVRRNCTCTHARNQAHTHTRTRYQDITTGLVYTDLFERWCRYRKWRPQVADEQFSASRQAVRGSAHGRSGFDGAAWWRYAGRCVSFDLAATRSRAACSWSMLAERNTTWRRYTELSARRLGNGLGWVDTMTTAEEKGRLRSNRDEP